MCKGMNVKLLKELVSEVDQVKVLAEKYGPET